MSRQSRQPSGTGIYHVMLRGINRQDIFEEQENYQLNTLTGDVLLASEMGVTYNGKMTDSELQLRLRRGESFLLASDGQFLGQLSSNPYLSESVMNQYGSYGSKYSSTSIFNKYSRYGSEYNQLSPFNQYTQHPPRIFLHGQLVGYLSVNQFVRNRLDPHQLFDYIANNGL